jgi:AcrR family transcriptional regulator
MSETAAKRTGRPAKQAAQALGDHVLAVADALFVQNGYGGTSMATVALQAHVGKQTLYRRFPDKAALFREVVRRRIDDMFEAVPVPPSSAADPLIELKAIASAALDFVLAPDFARLYRIVIAEALIFPELGSAAADKWGAASVSRSIAAVARAQANGQCRAGDPSQIAMALIWSILGQAFHDVMTGAGTPFADEAAKAAHIDQVWTLFLAGAVPPRV